MDRLLLAAIALPVLGSILSGVLAPFGRSAVRQSALVTTLLTLVVAGLLVAQYPGGEAVFAGTSLPWLGAQSGLDIELSVGLDGLSVWLFGLSALLMVTSVLVSWEAIKERPATFYGLLLMLEAGVLGVFSARDIILFYVFFEFTLIPLFFLIGIWGSHQRRYAAIKFFIYTLAGSMLTFVGLLTLVLWYYRQHGTMTFSIAQLTAGTASAMPVELQVGIFLALLAGLAVKVPLFPLHTWLPLAHVEAPTAGSVILAGVLLKIGTYGFVRFNMAMLPDATAILMPYLLGLSVAGIIYGALVSLAQKDIKRLIAYSSVSHLGFCMLGLLTLNRLGVQGGTLQMINHGLSTGGLFACVGMLYERYHTREIDKFGGLAYKMPVLAFFMLVFTLSSIGLPGLNGFVGEFLVLIGMFQRAFATAPGAWTLPLRVIAVTAVLGVVLGAWYMLWLVERVFFGQLREPSHESDHPSDLPSDLGPREILALVPLVIFVVWIGVRPDDFLRPMAGTLNQVTQTVDQAYQRQHPPLAGTEKRMLANAAPRARGVGGAQPPCAEFDCLSSVGNALRGVPGPAVSGMGRSPFPTETATGDTL